MGSSAIGTAHLLMGLLREGGNMGLRILRTVGVDPNKMYSAVLKKLNDMPRAAAGGASAPNREADKKNKTLAEYTRDLTEAPAAASWTPLSAGIPRYSGSSRFCPAAVRTTLCSSASPA